nr:hypothetical protein [Actinomycetota bacterium]
MTDSIYLFQYGSNMSAARLRAKIDEFSTQCAHRGTSLDLMLIGAARLARWRLTFDLYSAQQRSLVVDITPGGEGDEV